MEKSFVMVKPDGVKRKLIGEIIQRLEKKGLTLEQARMQVIPRRMAEEHYREHVDKPYFNNIVDFISSGPVLAMVWSGPEAITLVRKLVGHRLPDQAEPGTIRGDYATISTENLIHASDSPQSAQREINLFFGRDNYD